jgi:hypothetical protein
MEIAMEEEEIILMVGEQLVASVPVVMAPPRRF